MAPTAGRLAARVGAGILVTRILGFVRERVFAHYFGNSPAADAFRAALKIPNVIRNLLGEGTLAASFVPVYAGMIERGDHDGARRLSSVIASLLTLLTAVAAVIGVVLAPAITDFAAPGFSGDTRDLTVILVAILFPMSGITILSAWCLGVLNTHRRFFLSYAAPALWNVAQIATLVALGAWLAGARLAIALAFGALAGSVLQLAAQLPLAIRLAGGIHWSTDRGTPGVREVIRTWVPVVIGAGVAQVSSIIDTQLGSLLGTGAVATLGYAQLIAILPVSLFGVSVAAAALPELSRAAAGQGAAVISSRIADGTRRVMFFVVPSAVAFAAVGAPLVALLFETGQFGPDDTAVVSAVLAAYAIGIPGQASVKLFASGFYALGDTRSPVRAAVVSMMLSALLSAVFMRWLGPAGIALGASIAAYANLLLNWRGLSQRMGLVLTGETARWMAVTIGAAAVAGAAGWGTATALAGRPPLLTGTSVYAAFGLAYLGVTALFRHPDALSITRRLGARRPQ